MDYTGIRPILAKYQFSPTNIVYGWNMHYRMLIGDKWCSARTGRMPLPV